MLWIYANSLEYWLEPIIYCKQEQNIPFKLPKTVYYKQIFYIYHTKKIIYVELWNLGL